MVIKKPIRHGIFYKPILHGKEGGGEIPYFLTVEWRIT